MSKSLYVLDASAIMAVVRKETGCERVEAVMNSALVSSVNFSEVVAKLSDYGIPIDIVQGQLSALQLEIIDFDTNQALKAGSLRSQTRASGLSLGDRACLALALTTGTVALTADRIWESLDIGADVELIR